VRKTEEQRWEKLIHPDDYDRVVNGYEQFTTNKPEELLWVAEYRFQKADGNFALVADRAFPIYDQLGKLVRMVGSTQDITEKREMETKFFTEKMQHQRMLAQVVLDTQEKEREVIGRELHDNVNQILSTSKLYLEVSGQDESKREEFVKMGIKNINDAINEVRSISRSLVPVALGDLGLIPSIKDLVENIRKTKLFDISFSYSKLVERVLTEPQKLTVFRIIQEQVNNIQKHAAARSAKVALTLSKDEIQLVIQDDGKGFDCKSAKSSGLGLINIKSRVELFDGSMQLQSEEGEGCELLIQIPIQNN
jgi:signal transduction histidine kinase